MKITPKQRQLIIESLTEIVYKRDNKFKTFDKSPPSFGYELMEKEVDKWIKNRRIK